MQLSPYLLCQPLEIIIIISKAASTFRKMLASMIGERRKIEYSQIMSWIRHKLSFALPKALSAVSEANQAPIDLQLMKINIDCHLPFHDCFIMVTLPLLFALCMLYNKFFYCIHEYSTVLPPHCCCYRNYNLVE